VTLSMPIHPVTATSMRAAFTRRLESLRASHGLANTHSSVGGAVRCTAEMPAQASRSVVVIRLMSGT